MPLRSVNVRWSRLAGMPLAAALLLAGAVVVGSGGPAAYAAAGTITCTGSSPITYSPGLTFTARTITYEETDSYTNCVSSDPTLTSGLATASATGQFSCLGLPIEETDPGYTVIWNNGQSSTFTLTYTDTIAGGVEDVTGVGTVTSGELAGATAAFQWVYTVPDPLLCLTTGVTSQSGTVAATILGT